MKINSIFLSLINLFTITFFFFFSLFLIILAKFENFKILIISKFLENSSLIYKWGLAFLTLDILFVFLFSFFHKKNYLIFRKKHLKITVKSKIIEEFLKKGFAKFPIDLSVSINKKKSLDIFLDVSKINNFSLEHFFPIAKKSVDKMLFDLFQKDVNYSLKLLK